MPQAARCAALFDKVAPLFHAAFYDAGHGWYGSGLQTEQALPLYLDIVPAAEKVRLSVCPFVRLFCLCPAAATQVLRLWVR